MPFTDAAQAALSFARQHHWGQSANLALVCGEESVIGLVERMSGVDDRLVVLPATRSALRGWFY